MPVKMTSWNLEYGVVAWSPHYRKDKELLEKVQHRFTRIFPHLRELPYTTRLGELKLWTLEERRNRADLIEVYKMMTGSSRLPFETFFEISSETRTRGNKLKLVKTRCRLDLRQHFFSERRLIHGTSWATMWLCQRPWIFSKISLKRIDIFWWIR